jgi:hypothetical protein
MGLHEYIYVNEYIREVRLLYVVRLLTKREQAKLFIRTSNGCNDCNGWGMEAYLDQGMTNASTIRTRLQDQD